MYMWDLNYTSSDESDAEEENAGTGAKAAAVASNNKEPKAVDGGAAIVPAAEPAVPIVAVVPAAATPIYNQRQRVLVHWGPEVSYAAHIIDIRYEERRGHVVQDNIQVEYEIDRQRLWHEPTEMEPLGDDVVVSPPSSGAEIDDDVSILDAESRWQLLSIRCSYSLQRLTDPARCSACAHPSCCNYESLRACVRGTGACPVVGCTARTTRVHEVVRDECLRTSLAALPSSAQVCWVRGEAEVRLEPPPAPAATSASRRRKRSSNQEAKRPAGKRSRRDDTAAALVEEEVLKKDNIMDVAEGDGEEDATDEDGWVQCDACDQWRRVAAADLPTDENARWLCSMNTKDPLHCSCDAPEEAWQSEEEAWDAPDHRSTATEKAERRTEQLISRILDGLIKKLEREEAREAKQGEKAAEKAKQQIQRTLDGLIKKLEREEAAEKAAEKAKQQVQRTLDGLIKKLEREEAREAKQLSCLGLVEYVVDQIIGERTRRSQLEYRVKWVGYDDVTWEPAAHLTDTFALDTWLKGEDARVGQKAAQKAERQIRQILDGLVDKLERQAALTVREMAVAAREAEIAREGVTWVDADVLAKREAALTLREEAVALAVRRQEAIVAAREAESAEMWFPRPKGRVPMGSNGESKTWCHSTGTWIEESLAVGQLGGSSKRAWRWVPMPLGGSTSRGAT